jgi:glycosyltransferase involved in cell wall biosynthesis
MGFEKSHYVPNGVNEDLFKPINPIKKEGDLVVGHVGKECPAKGQREFILPAIQATGCKSATNLRTWKIKFLIIKCQKYIMRWMYLWLLL